MAAIDDLIAQIEDKALRERLRMETDRIIKEKAMSKTNELEAWKLFLRGRISQKQGQNQEAIKSFDTALSLDPGNSHFLNAKAIALSALNHPEAAMAVRLVAGYALAKKHSGDQDKSGPWIEGLEMLLNEAETAEKSASLTSTASVCW